MARTHIEEIESPYYPRRARWYSRLLRPWFTLHRLLQLDRLHLPDKLNGWQCLLSLVLPGYALAAVGRKTLGSGLLAAYVVGALVFMAALGYLIGNVGYGAMVGAHATSILFFQNHWLRGQSRFAIRFALAGVTVIALWAVVYAPAIRYVQSTWCFPLRVRDQVVIVQRMASPAGIQRGDSIAYTLPEHSVGNAHGGGGALLVRAGLGCGPILAMAGDLVKFSPEGFEVNGRKQPLQPNMPSSGELVVPENNWFIWPQFAMYNQGNARPSVITDAMLQMAKVREDQFMGKAYKHWFGRRQKIS